MSSFTSSSSAGLHGTAAAPALAKDLGATARFRRAATVLLPTLAVLLTAEIAVRMLVASRGADMRHIRSIPSIAERLGRAEGPRLLFLGNSLTRTDVDIDTLRQGLTEAAAERVYPDDTKIGEWYYAFKHYFVTSGNVPNVLVLGFVGRQVEDYGIIEPARMASAYGGLANTRELFATDITDFGSRTEFFLSSFSAGYANREKVKNRVMDALIPHYGAAATRMNHALRDRKQVAEPPRTYSRLERLLSLAERNRVHVVLVSMPQPDSYPVDEALIARLRERGATYVDCRRIDGIGAEHFSDGYHLAPSGAQVFSRILASRLSPVVRDAALRASVHARREQQ